MLTECWNGCLRSLRARFAVVLVLGIVTGAEAQPVATFQALGDLPEGAFGSEARGVSDDGLVVVGTVDPNSESAVAFRWTASSGLVSLGDLPGGTFDSEAFGVSGDGMVIVGSGHSESGPEAFRWTPNQGMVGLGDFPGDIFWSAAHAVSADGSVIVGAGFSTIGQEVFRWTQSEGLVGLGLGDASGITPDGLVIVGTAILGENNEAFRWTAQTGMVGLGDLPGGEFFSQALDVSADGSVVVGWSKSDVSGQFVEAFRWTESTGMVGLGFPPQNPLTGAWGVSADGSRIVGWVRLFWDATHGTMNLNTLLAEVYGLNLADIGWTWTLGFDINPDGHIIVGSACNPDGNREAAMVTLPCFGDAECDDVNACTQDTCVNFRCTHTSLCGDGNPCTSDRCVAGVCQNLVTAYGDVNRDGTVNLFDLFCVLNGFSGDFMTCPLSDLDLEPCGGDGTINLFDLFAVLNAFAGADPCCGE